jgi:leucyl aminopeptidase (aminopeptidase T)
MFDPRVAKLGDLLVNYSLELRPGQQLRIDAGTVAAPLVTEAYRSAVRAGGNPRTRIEVDGLDVIAVGSPATSSSCSSRRSIVSRSRRSTRC